MNRLEITRYSWYAIGGVLLIFIGISLALWFENWNDSRNIRQQEIAAPEDIAANLQANVADFEENIEFDRSSIDACKAVIANLENQTGWNPEVAGQLNETDRSSWNFQSAVIEPVFNRHMRKSPGSRFDPVDYPPLIQAHEFLNMVHMKISYQEDSIVYQQNSREGTLEVIAAIDKELQRLN